MGKCSDLLNLLINGTLIVVLYISVIRVIEYFENSTFMSVVLCWLANFLMPFAFAVFVKLKFDMKEIMQIMHFVGNALFFLLPVIILLATVFSLLILFLPKYYDHFLIIGIKIYLGAIALLCEGMIVKKLLEELFCDEVDTKILNDYSKSGTVKQDEIKKEDLIKNENTPAQGEGMGDPQMVKDV